MESVTKGEKKKLKERRRKADREINVERD